MFPGDRWFRALLLPLLLATALCLQLPSVALSQQSQSDPLVPNPGFGQEPKTTTSTGTTGSSGSAGFGQEPSAAASLLMVNLGKPSEPQTIQQKNPSFLVRADVNHGTRVYREGDTLSISVACEIDAYIYVLYKQADNQIFLIFPNSTQSNNRVRARQAVQLPGPDDVFTWVVGPPFGKEYVKVIASREPLENLSDPAMRQKFFNQVNTSAIKGIQLELGKTTSQDWSEDCVEIVTCAAGDPQGQSSGRRVGLFVGIGQYNYLSRTQSGADGKQTNVFEPNHRDARTLSGVMQEVGRMSEVRLLTNAEATRNNVEEAMTQWLPTASQPGDTVVIFFSGVALPVSQAAGVQSDGVVLPLYDFMSMNTVQGLQKQRDENKITTGNARQLRIAEEVFTQAGGQDRGRLAVAQAWSITEERFSHWLQGLAGRQILVILDSAYASAFAPQQGSGSGVMANGVARLQRLGQQDIALLGASGQQMFDVQRDPQGLSLMTQLLIQAIQESTGALTVEDAHRQIAAKMSNRSQTGGSQSANYQPYLVNTSTRKVFVKP